MLNEFLNISCDLFVCNIMFLKFKNLNIHNYFYIAIETYARWNFVFFYLLTWAHHNRCVNESIKLLYLVQS